MAKINIGDMMSEFDEMDSLLEESESARRDVAASTEQAKIEPLVLEAFECWFGKESYVNLSSTYLKGHRTKVSDKNFIKMINALAPSISRDDILVLKDTTFSGADEGMIITSDKVYFRNGDGRGEIEIRNMDSVYTKRAFFGNTVDITDKNGKVWHLGQVSALKEELEALDDAFSQLIEGVKSL